LDFLDPKRELIHYRLYRNNCVKINIEEGKTAYVKDLRLFRDIDLKDIVIIDNSVLSFAFQLNNGIPIFPYYDNDIDTELDYLENYLLYLAQHSDIRVVNKTYIQIEHWFSNLSAKSYDETEMDEEKTEDDIYSVKSKKKSNLSMVEVNLMEESKFTISNYNSKILSEGKIKLIK
jgi:CTD small phosphatase-like protein 2